MTAMRTRFRNLEFDPDAPLDEWPAEAIETIVDRGSLSDWRELAGDPAQPVGLRRAHDGDRRRLGRALRRGRADGQA